MNEVKRKLDSREEELIKRDLLNNKESNKNEIKDNNHSSS